MAEEVFGLCGTVGFCECPEGKTQADVLFITRAMRFAMWRRRHLAGKYCSGLVAEKAGFSDSWQPQFSEGRKAGSDFDYAAALTELIPLGTLAIRTGESVRWEAANTTVLGNEAADKLVRSEVRSGWAMGDLR